METIRGSMETRRSCATSHEDTMADYRVRASVIATR